MTHNSGVLIVGELNPYGSDPSMALYHLPRHASGNRLRQHLGLSDAVYARIKKMNLCTGRWSIEKARERALAVKGEVSLELDVVVLLGAKVRGAFGYADYPFFMLKRELGVIPTFVLLPHPSGMCREWNKPDARKRARELLTQARPDVPWGAVDD